MIGLRQNANFGKISAFLLLYSVLVRVVPVEELKKDQYCCMILFVFHYCK